MKKLIFTALACIGIANVAKSETCYFEVDNEILIEGTCSFVPFEGGDFGIYDNYSNPIYFAFVYIDGNFAEGWWNEDAGAGHAHTPLGSLRRVGGCWINQTVRVCAWK